MPHSLLARAFSCAIVLLVTGCTPGGTAAPIAGPTTSDCDEVQVGATCQVTVSLSGNTGSHHGVAFEIASQAFELLIPGSQTGALTAGCLISNGATQIGIVCGDAFDGDGTIAVLSFRRVSDGAAAFEVQDAVLVSADLSEVPIRGGTLVVR